MDDSSENAERQRIFDIVGNPRAVPVGSEGMLVPPQRVGTAHLRIDEAIWRIPLGNLAAPSHGNAVHAQLVFDGGSGTYRAIGVHGITAQEGWRELLKVLRRAKEFKNFTDRLRQPLLAMQTISGHRVLEMRAGQPKLLALFLAVELI